MGVNMAGNCIIDDEACCEASKMEIIRRYYTAVNKLVKEEATENEVYKIELLMNRRRSQRTTDMSQSLQKNVQRNLAFQLQRSNFPMAVSLRPRHQIFSVRLQHCS